MSQSPERRTSDRRYSRRDSLDSDERREKRRSERKSEKESLSTARKSSYRSGQREVDSDDEDDSNARSRRHRDHDDSRNDRNGEYKSSRKERRYRERSRSRSRERSHRHHRSRSPPPKRRHRSGSDSPSPGRDKQSRAPLPSQEASFRGNQDPAAAADGGPMEKQKPNYKPTGLLAKEANTVADTTTVLKYHEPPEARKPSPKEAWRMYVFKKKDLIDTIYLHERSVWLMGRDKAVTDFFLEHPSISKQHAVIQFRYITSTNEFGDKSGRVKPYLIDLESANGTMLNGKKVEASRFVELVDGDVVAFGESEREYVLMLPPNK